MSKVYLTLADGFEKLAAGYRALAEEGTSPTPVSQEPIKEEPSIDIETVRAVLAEKSRDGKTKEIKALLMKYDAGKLSGVKPEDYASLLSEAEAL
jgi:hypothetical protein